MHSTLISTSELKALLAGTTPLMIFDCSFDLMNPATGEQQYQQAHIPGARYVNLDTDLSARGQPDAASGGRHPLPSREKFAQWLSRVGFHNATQAVVYDRNGVNYCGRLWWMFKWVGHEAAAVLDGGLQAWQAAGGELSARVEPLHPQSTFQLGPALRTLVSTHSVESQLGEPDQTLIDARASARFKGEVEPLDPVAGHIPGALNRPFNQNLDSEGRFKSPAQLKSEFEQLLAGRKPSSVVQQCGSGVSAIVNALAMEIAGLGQSALYAGSWSEWCSDPKRPSEKG